MSEAIKYGQKAETLSEIRFPLQRPSVLGRLRLLLFGVADDAVSFKNRGFADMQTGKREYLEQIGRTFLYGYRIALSYNSLEAIATALTAIATELRGFAYEGAAMGLAIRDLISNSRQKRWRRFLKGPGSVHIYLLYVGLGWALARLPINITATLRNLDPLLRWLVIDGYGFHQGYFHSPRFVTAQEVPRRLSGYACRAFDQGLGRCLWFFDGADPERIAATVRRFSEERRGDLWSGIGLATAYAGGADMTELTALFHSAGQYQQHLGQGATFGAKARDLAQSSLPCTELACQIFCGMSGEEAAAITDEALEDLPEDGLEPAYEVWRRRVRGILS